MVGRVFITRRYIFIPLFWQSLTLDLALLLLVKQNLRKGLPLEQKEFGWSGKYGKGMVTANSSKFRRN
jgi:hypothetical protein